MAQFDLDKPGSKLRTISDNKAFVCVIRSGFKNKTPQLFKIRQEEQDREAVYYCWDRIGPCFGTQCDLKILEDDGDSHNYVDHNWTVFEGDIYGNILCGGHSYNQTNKDYCFTIIHMTTFEILVDK